MQQDAKLHGVLVFESVHETLKLKLKNSRYNPSISSKRGMVNPKYLLGKI